MSPDKIEVAYFPPERRDSLLPRLHWQMPQQGCLHHQPPETQVLELMLFPSDNRGS